MEEDFVETDSLLVLEKPLHEAVFEIFEGTDRFSALGSLCEEVCQHALQSNEAQINVSLEDERLEGNEANRNLIRFVIAYAFYKNRNYLQALNVLSKMVDTPEFSTLKEFHDIDFYAAALSLRSDIFIRNVALSSTHKIVVLLEAAAAGDEWSQSQLLNFLADHRYNMSDLPQEPTLASQTERDEYYSQMVRFIAAQMPMESLEEIGDSFQYNKQLRHQFMAHAYERHYRFGEAFLYALPTLGMIKARRKPDLLRRDTYLIEAGLAGNPFAQQKLDGYVNFHEGSFSFDERVNHFTRYKLYQSLYHQRQINDANTLWYRTSLQLLKTKLTPEETSLADKINRELLLISPEATEAGVKAVYSKVKDDEELDDRVFRKQFKKFTAVKESALGERPASDYWQTVADVGGIVWDTSKIVSIIYGAVAAVLAMAFFPIYMAGEFVNRNIIRPLSKPKREDVRDLEVRNELKIIENTRALRKMDRVSSRYQTFFPPEEKVSKLPANSFSSQYGGLRLRVRVQ